jgi:kynurenine formamidase
MVEDQFHRLSTHVEPFMYTQRDSGGYTTSYAQIRVHHGTHVDFPAHIGLDGKPTWDLSGPARIVDSRESYDESAPILFFNTHEQSLSDDLIGSVVADETVRLVGTDHDRVGDREAHERLLDNGVLIAENLVNVEDVPSTTGYAYCFPMIIEECDDGAPLTVAFSPEPSSESGQ